MLVVRFSIPSFLRAWPAPHAGLVRTGSVAGEDAGEGAAAGEVGSD